MPAGRNDRGFALLLVLWTMALLSLLAAQVTGAGRAETKLAAALRTGAQLQATADGAIYEVIWHLLEGGGDYWPPGAFARVLDEPGGHVLVTATEERGKLDINQVPVVLLQALFSLLGADSGTSLDAANGVVDWRTQQPPGASDNALPAQYRSDGRVWGPPGQEFQRLDELRLVRGMTEKLYQASLPYLTLALEQGPWIDFSDPIVIAALAKARRDSGLNMDKADPRGPIVLRLTASVTGANGAAFTRRVLLRLDGGLNGPAWKYRILSWENGAAPAFPASRPS